MTRYQDRFRTFGTYAIIVGGVILFRALANYRKRAMAEDLGTIPIKSAPQGHVEIEGAAFQNKKILSPVTQDEVAFFSFVIERYEKNGKNSSWVKIFEGQSHEDFYITDRSGSALVSVKNSDFDLTPQVHPFTKMTPPQLEHLSHYVSQHGGSISFSRFFDRTLYRAVEKCVVPEETVFVLGFHEVAHRMAVAAGDDSAPQVCGALNSDARTGKKLFFADCSKKEFMRRLARNQSLEIIGGALLVAIGALAYFVGSF